jgi:predicted DNA binding protein
VRTVFEERQDRSAVVLTPPQEELVVAAYENGYFAQPREASLRELAESLDISPSAASGRLRRAIESLVAETVVDGERSQE